MSHDWTQDGGKRSQVRMDFKTEVEKSDVDTQKVYLRVFPDPRRYDVVERNGQKLYVDRYLRVAVPEKEMLKAAESQIGGIPIYANPASIESSQRYAAERRGAISSELEGGPAAQPVTKTKPQENLHPQSRRALSFLSVDICDSTSLRASDPSGFDRSFEVFLKELGAIVGAFYGDILKTTGDGFIAYLDYPNWTTQCDNTIGAGLAMIEVVRDSIAPTLEASGLPSFPIRIGADYGPAVVRQHSVPTTGFTTIDIASDALNRCVKIENAAGANEMWIGHGLYEQVHVQWLERCSRVDVKGVVPGNPNYPVYGVC